jgi:hypothetical protein
MHIQQFFLLCLIASLVLLSGCGPNLPDGMPRLYPVVITVTQEGQPLANCSVSLRYTDPSLGTWAIGGRTDAQGNAQLFTNGFPGAPEGTFKVVLVKHENIGLDARAEAEGRNDFAAARAIQVRLWSAIELRYNDPATTPLEVEITPSTRTLSVDAGPAVQIDLPLVP